MVIGLHEVNVPSYSTQITIQWNLDLIIIQEYIGIYVLISSRIPVRASEE